MHNDSNIKSSKKSFILYHDSKHYFEMLEDTKAGILIKAIFDYEINNTLPDFDNDISLKMAFTSIKLYLDRDKEKYQNICKRNQENAKKKWNKENTCDNITVNNDNDIEIEKIENSKAGVEAMKKAMRER